MASKKEPHPGIPESQLTDLQRFDRMVFWRGRAMYARSQTRKFAALAVEMHGDAMRDHLPEGVTVDSDGVVRIDDEYQQEEQWREGVRMFHARLGAALLDHLPPDTTIDTESGEVTVDPDENAWIATRTRRGGRR